jgi:S1-C subfamily serine protease
MTDHGQPHRSPGLFAVAAVSALIAVVFGSIAGSVAGDMRGAADAARYEALMDAARSEESRRIEVVDRAMPAVVSIIAEKDVPKLERYDGGPFADDFFDQFFGGVPGSTVPEYRENGTERREIGAGTGFLVSSDGLIVTNKHVVSDEAAEYTVITNDGERHAATVLGRDPSNDLAILKLAGEGWPFIELSGSLPKVGQSVIAVGYALGQFSNSVSTGIVSGLSRSIRASDSSGLNAEDLYDVIQTDAAINPGNSGGPLLDIEGKAIGVNVAVVQGSENIGFALPSTDVRRVVESVQRTGRIARPFLGVRYVIIDADLAEKNQLPHEYGALIVRGDTRTDLAVIPGSPADLAGISENDIILEIGGERVTAEHPLAAIIRTYAVGEKVSALVYRKGGTITVEIELTERE